MEAVILAGGLGTRLKDTVPDLPKPMAPVGDKPFLEYILEYIRLQGVTRTILSVGYRYDKIESYFGSTFRDMSIVYSIENEPLGTGGAIKKAFEKVCGKNVFILNGDTFFAVSLSELVNLHTSCNSDLTLSLKSMEDFDRYGVVETKDNTVTGFFEKKYYKTGAINGGVYMAKTDLFEGCNLPDKFSFETDFMEKYVKQMHFNAIVSDGYFIDIGIPKDYFTAQRELGKYL